MGIIRSPLLVWAVLASAVLTGCGSGNDVASPGPAQEDSASAESPCTRLARTVEDYDVLRPGASRAGYLIVLHKLQRDCPAQAQSSGLTGEGLHYPCPSPDAESCTDYKP